MDNFRIPYSNPVTEKQLEDLHNLVYPGPLLILTHDNPDPDALASGKALAFLFQKAWGITSRMVYSGLVARAENKAMLNLLTPEWEHLDSLCDFDQFSAIALIDTQPGAGNNRFPVDYPLRIVIDHHPPRSEDLSKVPYVDIQPETGATVSIVFQYLEKLNLQPDPDLATAIFYGVRTDTQGLSRDSSPADQIVYFKLLSILDHEKLVLVEQAGLPSEYFRAFDKGLSSTKMYERVLVTFQGEVHRPDFPAEMADLLIRHEKIWAVLCMGYHEGVLYLSMRTKKGNLDAGSLILQLVPAPGKAGGHGKAAGGQVPISDQHVDAIANQIEKNFLNLMGENGSWQPLLM